MAPSLRKGRIEYVIHNVLRLFYGCCFWHLCCCCHLEGTIRAAAGRARGAADGRRRVAAGRARGAAAGRVRAADGRARGAAVGRLRARDGKELGAADGRLRLRVRAADGKVRGAADGRLDVIAGACKIGADIETVGYYVTAKSHPRDILVEH